MKEIFDNRMIAKEELKNLKILAFKWVSGRPDSTPEEYQLSVLVDVDEFDYRSFQDYGWYLVRFLAVQEDKSQHLISAFESSSEVAFESISKYFITGMIRKDTWASLPKKGDKMRVLVACYETVMDETDPLSSTTELHVKYFNQQGCDDLTFELLCESDEKYFREMAHARHHKRTMTKLKERQDKEELERNLRPRENAFVQFIKVVFYIIVALFLFWWIGRGIPDQPEELLRGRP